MPGRDTVVPVHVAGLIAADEQNLIIAQEEHMDGDGEFGMHGGGVPFNLILSLDRHARNIRVVRNAYLTAHTPNPYPFLIFGTILNYSG